jgi:predicted nucleic acid-binding protein
LSFDLGAALRALKPQKQTGSLRSRDDAWLRWVEDETPAGGSLLLDTTVYIDVLQGRAPDALKRLISIRNCFHSAVCMAELTYPFGRLDPAHPGTKAVLAILRQTIDEVPAHRLLTPSADLWGRAGILAGVAMRLRNAQPGTDGHRRLLNDAIIQLQARQIGAAVLTANIRDFDDLGQISGSHATIMYRRASSAKPDTA